MKFTTLATLLLLVVSYLAVGFGGFYLGYEVEPQSSFWSDDRNILTMLHDNSTPRNRLDRMKKKHEDVSCKSRLLRCQHERKALQDLQYQSQTEWTRSMTELEECIDRLGE